METLIIHPVDEAQQKALQAILDGLKVPYDTEPVMDETDYLTSTKANKESLDEALKEYKDGKGTAIKVDDLWK
ncbi:DUF2683 family protein [Mucilaginibacter paludis]|uniref:Uncharacterized protein n=1 Tax=Mucilaginibacter paludis DSM 18603 TaxID=714943 RepID=H1XZJ0_9SPHI|nr:DUF2683 family protein [Mucilaginibacter paludis]EHQ26634.1 hypothetical protein Mucpa_2519 [Mucilaginibacter paludis DSM 18603]